MSTETQTPTPAPASEYSPSPPPSIESTPAAPTPTPLPPTSSAPAPPPFQPTEPPLPSTPPAPSTTPSSYASPPAPTNPSPPHPLPTSPPNTDSPKSAIAAIVGKSAAGVIACIVISVLIAFYVKKKRRRRLELIPEQNNGHSPNPPTDDYNGGRPPEPEDHAVKILPPSSPPPRSPAFTSVDNSSSASSGSKQTLPPSPGLNLGISTTFTYEDLEAATNGFSQTNLLGQGGFGYVYKGILPGSKTIAVKQLKVGGGQGEREFQAEVEIISRVHHRHLLSLVGYCIAGSQRLLVYEFVPNDTLEYHLHGKGQPSMEWSTRLKVATGASRGLAYLHEDCYPKIIHRDIKASNILLDSNFEAKVADFGLAKLAQDGFTHVSTRVMGTFGYLAPEYASSGKLTDKSDVFSFGVMLIELITGRRPVDTTTSSSEDSLVDWARPLLARAMEDGNLDAVVDPRIQNNYNVDEMIRVVACAASCVRHSARRRPRMGQVVRVLEGVVSIDDLYEGVTPGKSSRYSSVGSPDYDNSQYSEDRRKFRKMALGSQEYGTE